jgi:hypothetical protein
MVLSSGPLLHSNDLAHADASVNMAPDFSHFEAMNRPALRPIGIVTAVAVPLC